MATKSKKEIEIKVFIDGELWIDSGTNKACIIHSNVIAEKERLSVYEKIVKHLVSLNALISTGVRTYKKGIPDKTESYQSLDD